LTSLEAALAETANLVERQISELIPARDVSYHRLIESMRYAALGGGKRLRPFLLLQSAGLFGAEGTGPMRAAAAVELVHCYSLVHDDLPAMDDDDLRRGRPTVHIEFDEATAILAGEGLLTMAFEVLADAATHPSAEVRAALVLALARAAGTEGMVGGQVIDLAAEEQALDLAQISELQAMKTGALIAVSVDAGAILGQADTKQRATLAAYARDLGLAFQIADDLLDVEGDEAEVGKGVGKDATAGKATFVSILGADGARARANELVVSATEHLAIFDAGADYLREVAKFVVARRN
jgi:farnesyl diphosphate synthase